MGKKEKLQMGKKEKPRMGKKEKPQMGEKEKPESKKEKPQRTWKNNMGKPQRSKKHKKIKAVDPFYVGPRVVDRKAHLANKAPKNYEEESYMPPNEREIIRLKNAAKKMGQKSKKNKFKKSDQFPEPLQDKLYHKKDKGMTRPLKSIPEFKQHKNEKDAVFFNRMDRETQAVIRRTQLEDKFDIDIEETRPGQYQIEKRKQDDKPTSEKKKIRNKKKTEKRKEHKLEKMKDKVENFEEFTDEVKFGEVAMAPPTLTAKPRTMEGKTNRPGTKSLLLKDMMEKGKDSQTKPGPSKTERSQGVKRKKMSLAQQRIMDKERERVIELYRLMKKRKMSGVGD